jgi:hypothetical protein
MLAPEIAQAVFRELMIEIRACRDMAAKLEQG